MKQMLFLIFAVCFSVTVFGQQKNTNCHWQFHSINNIGLLEGETGSAFQIQSVNGMQYKSWFGGIGVGLDFYRYRTIPLFLDFRKEFGSNINKFFAYADGGVNFCWLTDNEKNTYLSDDHFDAGFYTDLGIGYKVGVGKNYHLLLSIGYSLKKLKETYRSYIYFPPDNVSNKAETDYSLNRLTMKIGWEF